MLDEQLKDQISKEGAIEAKKLTCRVPMFKFGYEAGYGDAGEKYAELWQSSEASAKSRGEIITKLNNRLTNLETALREIAEGNCDYESTGYVKSVHSTECKACMAKAALNPKPTTDE
jgi:hypothetical protein